MEITLSGWVQWPLVIIAVMNVIFVGILAFAALKMAQEVAKLRAQVQPIIDRVNPILEEARPVVANVTPLINTNVRPILGNVQEITQKVSGIVTDLGQHAHEIAETGEQTVRELTHRVEATGQVVTESVSKPVIGAASLFAGITRAVSVLKNYKSEPAKGNGRDHSHADGNGASATPAS